MTTRGLKQDDMAMVAEWMKRAIEGRDDEAKLKQIRGEVTAFASKFPLPSDR
jgi:glycine hydroxymethyltransferase